MRKSFVALLAVGAVAALASTAFAREEFGDDVGSKLVNAQMIREMRASIDHAGVSGSGPGTTYVGFRPGKVSATNYWGIGKGCFRVVQNMTALGVNNDYGCWTWDNNNGRDNITEVHGDSLFGWWPYRNVYTSTGGLTLTDDNRPWWAIDIGNNANYVINQGAGHKRTFGVVGVWHRDNGLAAGPSGGVGTWTALGGTHSLWCGLRRDGDLAFSDPITGNPFNARVLYNSGVGGGGSGEGIRTFQHFPGYGSQWDQMAYRDINTTGNSTIAVRFKFRSNMSTGKGTAPGTRTGWFDKDPLGTTPSPGNFISSSAAGDVNAPIDSFMVYVGSPVNDAACLYSDGGTRAVYDPQRRWFDEVIRSNEPAQYREILSRPGNNGVDDEFDGTPNSFTSTTGSVFGNKTRLVFRNKTNRGFDDEGTTASYSSGGAGAVIIDDVQVSLDGGAFTTIGDFETAAQVDNAANALDAWRTTGKPPAIYHHVHNVQELTYEDLCGPVEGPGQLRICNLTGNIISAGDHDNSEAVGGLTGGTADRERFDGLYSPTIQLRSNGGTNGMDINAAIAAVTEDYYIEYDIYTGVFDFVGQGNAWRFSFSAWPGKQKDGTLCWADWRFPLFIIFNPDKQCFQDQEPGLALGLVGWSAADAEGLSDYPDSLRIYLGKVQQCFRFGITTGCSPTDGCYWDNVSLAFINGEAPPMTVDIWQWINDTFTVNGLNRNGVSVTSAAFDTTTALIKTGLNIAQTSGNQLRYSVPGDTTQINALGNNLRMDMVFRIDPGPGNYRTVGNKTSGLRATPSLGSGGVNYTQTLVGQAFEHNFWAQYLNDNGGRGTGGNRAAGGDLTNGSGPGHPGAAIGVVEGNGGNRRWSNLTWNSARIDTAEVNLWQISSRGIGIPTPGAYATMYDETDPKYKTLGIAKYRCWLATATAANNQANTFCGDPSIGTDNWPNNANYQTETKSDGSNLPRGQTYEYTKILPDGQFTPGTHVEYFIRREDSPLSGGPFFCPDTSTVFPQASEGSTDAHRWQEFSVLPDKWKFGGYGGLGQACMLYVDLNDRRGNERVWVSIADSIGATRNTKYGAHNGWHQVGKVSLNDASGFVYNQNQCPGTTWDMYGVKASESLNTKVASIGVDFSNHASSLQIDNKWSFQGPSIGMLEAYYSVILLLSGDLNSGVLGPFNDLGNNDVKMLQDFVRGGTPTAHRGLWIEGDGFVESADGTASNLSLLNSYLYVSLRDPSYKGLTDNAAACIDLVALTPITTNGDIYGVRNGCLFTDDVLDVGSRAVPATLYSPSIVTPTPVIAGAFHDVDAGSGEYWQSLVDGFDIESVRSRFCDKSIGRLAYYYNVLTNIFGKICQIAGNPPITTDVPNNPSGQEFVDFMNLRNNPLVSGQATVDFGLSKADRVEVKVFDVSGRLVRTLADRQFAPGKHQLTWDGVDNDGRQVARGVYFTQVKYLNLRWTDAKKLTVLR